MELQAAAVHEPTFSEGLTQYYLGMLGYLIDTPYVTDQQARDAMQHLFNTASAEQLRPLYQAIIDPESALSRSSRFKRGSISTSLLGFAMLGEASASERLSKLRIILDAMTGGAADYLFAAWNMSIGDRTGAVSAMSPVYLTNFAAMCGLERMAEQKEGEPTICRSLFENDNIRCFARYAPEMLLEQYRDYGKTVMPYGVLVEAVYATDPEEYTLVRRRYEPLYGELKTLGYMLRVSEAADVEGFIVSAVAARQKYGKMSFMLVDGHGDARLGVVFGVTDKTALSLSPDVLQNVDLSPMRKIFSDDAFIVFMNCSVGGEGGTCQLLSAQLPGIPVTGAADLHVYEFDALKVGRRPEGQLQITPFLQYAQYHGERPIRIATATYRDGTKIE